MIRLARRVAFVFVLALAPLVAVRAEGVIDQVPSDAMGIAIVRDLAGTDAKIQQVVKIFENLSDIHLPAPLAFIKTATGLGDGLNENGDALLALLPGDANPLEPKPLLLVPVSDYAKFAASIGGDATGEICRVTIAGEEVLVAKRGDYAMLMNIEHRPRMEAILAGGAAAGPPIAPLKSWLDKNDFAVTLLPAGVDAIKAAAQAEIDAQRTQLENQFSDPQFAEVAAVLKQEIALSETVLRLFDAEIGAGAIGFSIDESANVCVSDRIVFKQDGQLAKLENAPKLDASPLVGFPAGPFVFAGGGPLPPAFSELMSKMSRKLMEQYPEQYGFQHFDEEQWNKIEESWKSATAGLRAMSIAMLPGGKDDALVSNIFYIVKVADSAAYLASTKKSTELWNELIAASSSDIKLPYEITDVEIGGKKGVLMAVDVGAAAADEAVPMIRPIFEAAFGADGKMRIYTIAADATTVVMGISKESQVAEAIKHAIDGDPDLAKSAEVQATAGLLDPAAPWTGYVSPQGCVLWFKRIVFGLAGPAGFPTITIPEYPVGPPLGFSTNLTSGQFHGEMVVPKKTMQDLAEFIKACQAV